MSKFILGAGISGLIWKFYNPEFEIISPIQYRPGTTLKVAEPFVKSNQIWLHDCPEVRQFLQDLGWKNPEKYLKKSTIGYYENGVIKDTLTPSLKKILVGKKMTPWQEEVKLIESQDSARLSLTTTTEKTNFMNTLKVDHGEIIYRLNEKCPITHGYVGNITDTRIGITNEVPNQDSEYIYKKYDQLISTIPASQFYRAWAGGNEVTRFESLPISFATTKTKPKEFDGDYEMVYYDDTVPFTRISHQRNVYCIEFTGGITKQEAEDKLGIHLREVWKLPQGRIKSQTLLPPVHNIVFSGRFAQWDHRIVTENVISEAVKYASKTTNSAYKSNSKMGDSADNAV